MRPVVKLLQSFILAGAIVCGSGCGTRPAASDFTFFAIGDPQVNLVKWGTAGTEATLDSMNQLPGRPFPGDGVVQEPLAVLVLGDLVDDIRNPANWERYKELFDINGKGRLRYKVYESLGNHDLGGEMDEDKFNSHQRDFIERNKSCTDRFHFDNYCYHYSWDWGRVHFVNLNAFPGNEPRPVYDRIAPWNDPKGSLDFLRADLARRVGDSGRPVVLCWHYGLEGQGKRKVRR